VNYWRKRRDMSTGREAGPGLSNGDRVRRVAGHAPHRGKSVDCNGYWQCHKVTTGMPAVTWNRRLCGGLAVSNLIHGVPVATITYETDVAPHLQRGLMYRRLRMQRWQALHAHDYDRYDDYDPYRWAKTGQFFNLLAEVIAIACFAAGSEIFRWLKLDRLHGAPGH